MSETLPTPAQMQEFTYYDEAQANVDRAALIEAGRAVSHVFRKRAGTGLFAFYAEAAADAGKTETFTDAQMETIARLDAYRASFPLTAPEDGHWGDRVVKAGHVDACAVWGHAFWNTNGVAVGRCPRCGEITEERKAEISAMTDTATPIASFDVIDDGQGAVAVVPTSPVTISDSIAEAPARLTPAMLTALRSVFQTGTLDGISRRTEAAIVRAGFVTVTNGRDAALTRAGRSRVGAITDEDRAAALEEARAEDAAKIEQVRGPLTVEQAQARYDAARADVKAAREAQKAAARAEYGALEAVKAANAELLRAQARAAVGTFPIGAKVAHAFDSRITGTVAEGVEGIAVTGDANGITLDGYGPDEWVLVEISDEVVAEEAEDEAQIPARLRYAIRHTFPNGETLGDGFVKSGTRSDYVASFTDEEAVAAVADYTAKNPGHAFEIVDYPA